MVNTFLDIRLKDSENKRVIDKVFLCKNSGSYEIENPLSVLNPSVVTTSKVDGEFFPLPYFKYTFSNLCYNYPYRIIIYGEENAVSCEKEWFAVSNFNLMYAYHRLTKILDSNLTPRIDYSRVLYANYIYKCKNSNGIEILYIKESDIFLAPYSSGSENPVQGLGDTLLLYPLVFKKKMTADFNYVYVSYNPLVGLSEYVGKQTVLDDVLYYNDDNTGIERYENEKFYVTNDTTKNVRFPLYQINTGIQLWNIDLDKLNIGIGLGRFQESY